MVKIYNKDTGEFICLGIEIENHKDRLSNADLQYTYLESTNLHKANLSGADLRGAILRNANLCWANLINADLRDANLRNVALQGANLLGAKIRFLYFPSIRLLSTLDLGIVSDKLTLELMRWDADGHPHPLRFDEWAAGGDCPYRKEDYFWNFYEKSEIWKSGKSQMTDLELIKRICTEKGWEY